MEYSIQHLLLLTFYGILLVQCSPEEVNTSTGPKFHGNIYVSCESPPWQINLEAMYAECNTEVSFDSLELDRSLAGCALEMIQTDIPDIAFNYSGGSAEQFEVIILNAEAQLKLTLNGENVDQLRTNEEELFFIIANEKTYQCYIKNFFIGGCFHEGFYWQEL